MFKKITIIGFGLIGSSIARAIKKNNLCKILVAHDKSKLVLKKTSKLNITNHIEPNLKTQPRMLPGISRQRNVRSKI